MSPTHLENAAESAQLVSVIVPTYNRAYCLPRAIDSALGQTHRAIEVIVLDDGSTDGTGALVARRYGRDRRVKYAYQANQGVASARNRAIALAQGEYLAFLDSDDVWRPWKLALQLACLRHAADSGHPIGMIWTDMEAVNPQDQVFDTAFLRTVYSAYRWFPRHDDLFSWSAPLNAVVGTGTAIPARRLYTGDIFSQMMLGNLVHTSTVLLTRERMERVGGFREDLQVAGEDYDFHLRTCCEGPVGLIDLVTIRYQRGMPDRLSQHGVYLATNFIRAIEPMLAWRRDRITLPDSTIRSILSEAHHWAGEELLNVGAQSAARGHLARAVLYDPRRTRALGLLFAASLPGGLADAARRTYRAAKSGLSRLTNKATTKVTNITSQTQPAHATMDRLMDAGLASEDLAESPLPAAWQASQTGPSQHNAKGMHVR